MMMNDKQIEEAKAALPLCKQIIELCGDNYWLNEVKVRCEDRVRMIERCQLFDIWDNRCELEYGCGMYKIDHICNYGDIEKQWLLEIHFPTGAYIFGDRYDREYFNQFMQELWDESLGGVEPDYKDLINHSLYYKPEKARKAWDHYLATWKKYNEGNKERLKEWKKQKLRKELEELERSI